MNRKGAKGRKRGQSRGGRSLVPVETVSAAMPMVRSGFGGGLAPLGLMLEMKLGRLRCRLLPRVTRRVPSSRERR
jgi:hypothetical protein